MQELPLQAHHRTVALESLQQSPLFGGLQPQDHETILSHGKLFSYEADETIIEEGQPSDSFFVLVQGSAAVRVALPTVQQAIEVSRINAPQVFGEMGLLLRHARTATVVAIDELKVLRFHHRAFDLMLNSIKGFTIQLCVTLARRLAKTSHRLPPTEESSLPEIDQALLKQFPVPFVIRHRVLPLKLVKNVLTLGCVEEPGKPVIQMVLRLFPGVQLYPQRITSEKFDQILRSNGLFEHAESGSSEALSGTYANASLSQESLTPPASDEERQAALSRLLPLLRRMVAEGASELYLSALDKPRWRIGDELYVVEDQEPMAPLAPFFLLSALIPAPRLTQFEEHHAIDFSCTVDELSRFRVHLFRSEKGVNAVLRAIPLSPPHPKQLQLPSALRRVTKCEDGLVLFAGPPGSGKTTTLSALLEVINHHRSMHIITLEDPIEYIHTNQRALFHQREVGSHTRGLRESLEGILRNLPDLLVVSDIRDHEVLSLVLEASRGGCLVFASMAVRGAVRAVSHLVEMFPAELQHQARHTLSKVLRCVVSQELCQGIHGGRVAAFEYLAVDEATASVIRQGEPAELIGLLDGSPDNLAMPVHLAQLVKAGQISEDEAYAHTVNRDALDGLLGHSLPMLPDAT